MALQTTSRVVAAFNSASDAQAAARDLVAQGISREDIRIETNDATVASGRETGAQQHEGGITGWFKSMFGSDTDADRTNYEKAVRSGSTLLSVDVPESQTNTVADILNRYNPVDVHRDNGSSTRGRAARAETATTSESEAIPVVEEQLRVGKRAILRGGVRVYSRVLEQPVEEDVNLREEHVRVDRQRVDRPANEADLRAGQERVVEVQEMAEEAVVQKRARVVEEVRVGKEATERTEHIRETVRRTEVDVEPLAGGQAHNLGGVETEAFRQDFQTRYPGGSSRFEDYAPAYEYGYQAANDPRFQGRDYNDIERELKTGYAERYPSGTWEQVKDSIRYGWDRVGGRR